MNIIIESIFFGYCFYTLFKFEAFIFIKKEYRLFSEEIDFTVIQVFRFAALFFAIQEIYNWVINYMEYHSEMDNYAFTNRMFGPHWYAYWMLTFTPVIVPQLLWIDKLKKSKLYRVVSALLILFIFSFEKFIIIITSFERDYIPSSWVYYKDERFGWMGSLIIAWIIKMAIFSLIICMTVLIKKRRAATN